MAKQARCRPSWKKPSRHKRIKERKRLAKHKLDYINELILNDGPIWGNGSFTVCDTGSNYLPAGQEEWHFPD